jgi:methyl-accepting chemotaxis protein
MRVDAGTEIANKTAGSLDEIVTGVANAAALVANIAAASNEQATGIAQINTGIEQVSNIVQTNTATAEESAAASEELSDQAFQLKEMVNHFRLDGQPNDSTPLQISGGQTASRQEEQSKPRLKSPRGRQIALDDKGFGKY